MFTTQNDINIYLCFLIDTFINEEETNQISFTNKNYSRYVTLSSKVDFLIHIKKCKITKLT